MNRETTPSSPDDPLSGFPTLTGEAARVFARFTTFRKVSVPDGQLGEAVELADDILSPILDQLAGANLLVRWDMPPGFPGGMDHSGPTLTFTPYTADLLRLKPGRTGTRWTPIDGKERSIRMKPQKLDFGLEIVAESDLKVDPPGVLAGVEDPKAKQPLDALVESEVALRDAERKGGYMRPLYVMGSGVAWPAATQDRGPWAPDAGPVPVGHKALAQDAEGPCGGCGGNVPAQSMCLVCDKSSVDAFLPKAIRAAAARAAKAEGEK